VHCHAIEITCILSWHHRCFIGCTVTLVKKISFIFILSFFVSINESHAQIDPTEYPPGHPNYNNVVSAVQQLQAFPTPRFKLGHTLLPSMNVIDPTYFAGYKQPNVTDAQAIAISTTIQLELAKNFGYMLNLSWSAGGFNDAWVTLANQYPQYKRSLMTLRAQTGGSKMFYQGFPNDHYMQNAAGQFIGWNNDVITQNLTWRPTAPINDYAADGAYVRGQIQTSLANLVGNVDLVNEDGEVYPIIQASSVTADPVVHAAQTASGLCPLDYFADKVRQNDNAYRDQFMSLPKLTSAKYTEYRMDGKRDNQLMWEETKHMMTPINGQYYSTGDFYVRWPDNWKDWVSAWHGLKWFRHSRYHELAAQNHDKLFSPFVAAGWDQNEENNVRPAQWLGLLKQLAMFGAEFYYTGYFNEAGNYNPPNPPPFNPKGYAWQAVMPQYSQAITSRYEEILRNGSLMPGDMPVDGYNWDSCRNSPQSPRFQFNPDYPSAPNTETNKVIAIRKLDSANKYAITGTIQNSSNVINSTPLTADASINLNGQNLKFKIRRQGSTYIYDNTVPTTPVFYQLDGWHEASHPINWSHDFNIEAELFDNGTVAGPTIKTEGYTGTDFRNAYSFVNFSNISRFAIYHFTPRPDPINNKPMNYYVWFKARSGLATNGSFNVAVSRDTTSVYTKTINGILPGPTWQYYRAQLQGESAISLTSEDHALKIYPNTANLEIDTIILTSNASYNPGGTTIVGQASSDITKPTVSIQSPASGTSVLVNTATNVRIVSGDNVGVTKLQVYWNSKLIKTITNPTTTYNYSWTPTKKITNKYLQVKATDAKGNVRNSKKIKLTIH
jgi:hypothetical protein